MLKDFELMLLIVIFTKNLSVLSGHFIRVIVLVVHRP